VARWRAARAPRPAPRSAPQKSTQPEAQKKTQPPSLKSEKKRLFFTKN